MDECLHNDAKCDLEVLNARLTALNKDQWWLEANNKPKLRTYVKVHDKYTQQAIVKRNLDRPHRSVIAKFKCGVLPIMIETGRYKDTPLEQRVCQMCNSQAVEDEEHFIGRCRKLKGVRDKYKHKFAQKGLDTSIINIDCISNMLKPDYVKLTSEMLLDLFELKKNLIYNIVHTH